jgi:hypothetical protein
MNYQEIFKDIYLEKIGIPYLGMNGKEGKSLKEVYGLINTFWYEFKGITLTEEQQLSGFKHFLDHIDDDFVLGSFNPSIILSCFNSLAQQQYSKVKKPDKTIRYTFEFPSDEALAEIAAIKEGYKRLRNDKDKR